MASSEDSRDSVMTEHPSLAPATLPEAEDVSVDAVDEANPDVKEIKIKSLSLYQIDASAGEARNIEITGDLTDLNGYLKNLLKEIDSQEHKRSYKVKRETTEFAVALQDFVVKDNLCELKSKGLAQKLLHEEMRVEKEYKNLNAKKKRDSIVNKGSYLQFLYVVNERTCYLGVKIEHKIFLDENDFKIKSGLPETSKVYKACRVIYSDSDFEEIYVYDKNTEPSVYWWDGFLELEVLRNDELNTRRAAQAIMRVLDAKVKKLHPEEYTQIRNAAIVALKQNKQINYNDLVDDLLSTAVFEDTKFNAKIPEIISALKKAPADPKDGFDLQFQGSPGAVQYRQRKVGMGRNIFLTYPEEIENLNSFIWARTEENGDKVVVVKSEEGYEHFYKPS